MQSSLIGKVEKARRYAQEPERVTFRELSATFRGEHDTYTVGYKSGRWQCTCRFFAGWGLCSHTMALQRLLGQMLPKEAIAGQMA
ncbi:MAG TPA: hypothetical protein G4O03_03220 [Dehalococcoidia bacterium]|nr:hypothetical protein [Dehalococcoidia bacterium]